MSDDAQLLCVESRAWRARLDAHEGVSDGTWLVIAKKGTLHPTSLTYAQALDEALCSGWIDGQRKGRDAATFLQRFTPRRPGSIWSKRNVALVERLSSEGRMRPLGLAQFDAARRDGRWERAYAGSASLDTPQDVAAALAVSPAAAARFGQLSAGERYPLLLGIVTAAPALRGRRITALVNRLEREAR